MALAGLADRQASELIALFRSRSASPVEAVEAALERIAEVEPSVNAVLTLCADPALRAAREAERRWKSGQARLLEGVPVGLKDVIMTSGLRTTGGSKIYADFVPTRSATVAERIENAGGIVLAKLQTNEFAWGENPHYGPTRNPWNLARTTGGSSSGPAAALAAREVPLAVGTDTGGSIRSPAAYCGVNGLKPTRGRVSKHGVMPVAWTLDHVGPMARSVRDVALMFSAMVGYDQLDAGSLHEEPELYVDALSQGINGLRIGIPTNWFFDVIDSQVASATQQAIRILEQGGAIVTDVTLPHADLAETIGWLILYAEFGSLHQVHFNRIDDYGREVTRPHLVNSQFITAADYLRALRLVPLVQHDFEVVFEQVDAIVVPGMLSEAPELNGQYISVNGRDWSNDELEGRTTFIFNVVGLPALAIPAGFSRDNLPIGIQIVARPLAERTCFRIGHAFQQLTSHHLANPPVLDSKPSVDS